MRDLTNREVNFYATVTAFRPQAPRRIYSITLDDRQMARVEAVADRIAARCKDKPNGHAAGNSITREDEVGGYAGELAASILLGTTWAGEESEWAEGPDVGTRTQVRTLTRPTSHRLLVRPHDIRKYGNVPFVLVRQEADGRTFTLLGWCMAREVFDLGQEGNGGHPNRPAVYLVHPKSLHHVRTLTTP